MNRLVPLGDRNGTLFRQGTMTRLLIVIVLGASFLGCASNPPSTKAIPSPPPQPSAFSVTATLTTDLPAQFSTETGLPPKLRGSLSANARAEAISSDPLRSGYMGTMSLVITNDEKTQTFIDLDITVDGASDGPPSNALADVFKQFIEAATLMLEPGSNIAIPKASP